MSRLGNLGHNLYTGRVSYDIVGRRNRWFIISGIVLVISLGTLATRGLNLGIEFKGGAEYSVPVSNPTTDDVTKARTTVETAGTTPSSVTIVGGDTIRVQTPSLTTTESNTVNSALAKEFSVADTDIKVETVGPTWGGEVSKNAARALAVFLILVALFLAIYFEWPMAIAGLVALLHDVLITVGIYALIGFEVTPATVIGFLTILGYSLYDTVVVFDKVRENTAGLTAGSRMTFSEAANLALNQTLARSINTSVVALLPVLSILVVGVVKLGAGTLNDLALALFIGMLVGTYSSIFVATPILAVIKERQPDMMALRKRVENRRKNSGIEDDVLVPVGTAAYVAPAGPRQQRVKKTRSKRSGR